MIALIVGLFILLILIILYIPLYIFTKKKLKNSLPALARILVILLVIQFLLGILSNLFATIPTDKPYLVFHTFGYILLHTINAMLLVVFSIIFLQLAIRTKNHTGEAIGGCLLILIAFISGILFVNLGQNNIFSLIMAISFIGSIMDFARLSFSHELEQKV